MEQPIQANSQAQDASNSQSTQTGSKNTTGMGFDKTVTPTEQPPIPAYQTFNLQQVWQKNSGVIKLLLILMLVNLILIMYFV